MIASDGINLFNSILLHTTLLKLFGYIEQHKSYTFYGEEY